MLPVRIPFQMRDRDNEMIRSGRYDRLAVEPGDNLGDAGPFGDFVPLPPYVSAADREHDRNSARDPDAATEAAKVSQPCIDAFERTWLVSHLALHSGNGQQSDVTDRSLSTLGRA